MIARTFILALLTLAAATVFFMVKTLTSIDERVGANAPATQIATLPSTEMTPKRPAQSIAAPPPSPAAAQRPPPISRWAIAPQTPPAQPKAPEKVSPSRTSLTQGNLPRELAQTLDKALEGLRRPGGEPTNYVRVTGPRALALCVDWRSTTMKQIAIRAFGSSVRLGLTDTNRQKGAIARCERSKPAKADCACTLAHVDGKGVLQVPDDWAANQNTTN